MSDTIEYLDFSSTLKESKPYPSIIILDDVIESSVCDRIISQASIRKVKKIISKVLIKVMTVLLKHFLVQNFMVTKLRILTVLLFVNLIPHKLFHQ